MIPRQGTAERQYYDSIGADETPTHLAPGWLESYVQIEMQRLFREQLQEMVSEMFEGKRK